MSPASPPTQEKEWRIPLYCPMQQGSLWPTCTPPRVIHPLKLLRGKGRPAASRRIKLAPVLPRPMWSLGPGQPPRLGHCLTSTKKGLGCTPRLCMCDVLGMTPAAQSRPLPLGRWGNGDGRPVSSGSRRPAVPGLLSWSPRPSKAASDPIKSRVTCHTRLGLHTWYPALQKLLDPRALGSA